MSLVKQSSDRPPSLTTGWNRAAGIDSGVGSGIRIGPGIGIWFGYGNRIYSRMRISSWIEIRSFRGDAGRCLFARIVSKYLLLCICRNRLRSWSQFRIWNRIRFRSPSQTYYLKSIPEIFGASRNRCRQKRHFSHHYFKRLHKRTLLNTIGFIFTTADTHPTSFFGFTMAIC